MTRRPSPSPAAIIALAVAFAVAAALAACLAASSTVRQGPAPHPGPPAPGGLRVLHLADFGDNTAQQTAVAGAVAAAQRRAPFDLALVPGDNLYECGPDAARPGAEACAFAADDNTVAVPPLGDDSSFARLHEVPLAALDGPVYLALGNHDVAAWQACATPGLAREVAARRKACLEVAHRSPRWILPARHYLVDQGPARFVVIDSNAVYQDYGGFTLEAELAFVTEAVQGCEARACFLVGHHPPVTAGTHQRDFDPVRTARFARLLAAAGPSLRGVLAGHDHDLQHLRTADGLDVLVSGNGARARLGERFEQVNDGGRLLFGSTQAGLGVLTVQPSGWSYRFEDAEGRPLHCCAAAGAGRCEPIGCAP